MAFCGDLFAVWWYVQRSSPPGVFIVVLGLVRVDLQQAGGSRQESRFVGVGGSVGMVASVIGRDLRGDGLVAAYAQVNVLFVCARPTARRPRQLFVHTAAAASCKSVAPQPPQPPPRWLVALFGAYVYSIQKCD